MSAMSGSMPVVSQSIMKPMVPVGASTVAWPLRKPCSLPTRDGVVPGVAGRVEQVGRHVRRLDLVDVAAVLLHHAAGTARSFSG